MTNKITIELIPDFGLPANTFVVCGDLHHPEIMHSLFMDDLDVKIANVIEWYKTINPDYIVTSFSSHLVGYYNSYKFIDHFKELIDIAVIKYPQSVLLNKLNDFSNSLPFRVDCEFFSNVFFREMGVDCNDIAASWARFEKMSGDLGGVSFNGRFEKEIVFCMITTRPQALLKVLTYQLTKVIKAKVHGGNNDQ